jgi:hypothetical protein
MKTAETLASMMLLGCMLACTGGGRSPLLSASGGTATSGAAASTSSGGSGTTTGSTGEGAGTTTSGSTSGTTGTGTSGMPDAGDAGPSCAPGATWFGDICLVTTCNPNLFGEPCRFADGGIGRCFGEQCFDPSFANDPNNCGAFGAVCPSSTTCVGGSCAVPDGGVTPPCSNDACPPNMVCNAVGACAWAVCDPSKNNQSCGEGAGTCCELNCVDPANLSAMTILDPQNCGACGVTCAAGQLCLNGLCDDAVVSCDSTKNGALCSRSGAAGLCCFGSCVDTLTDPANCYGCGFTCGSGFGCSGGNCTPYECDDSLCPAGTRCGPVDTPCLRTSCDESVVDVACLGTYDAGGGYLGGCCGGSDCIDWVNDPMNCGGCEVTCPDGLFCGLGQCLVVPDCASASPGVLCPIPHAGVGECCAGRCSSVFLDSENCGGCGSACPAGSTCHGDFYPGDFVICSGAACDQVGCVGGETCLQGSCVESSCGGVPDLTSCDTGQGTAGLCCNGTCSMSGCDAGPGCAPGSCGPQCEGAPCAFGQGEVVTALLAPGTALTGSGICCGGRCVDPAQDPANCGACGAACLGSCSVFGCIATMPLCSQLCPEGDLCFGAGCFTSWCGGPSQIGEPFPLCQASDGVAGVCCADFACADVSSDARNCGVCGAVCSAGKLCVNGSCEGVTDGCGQGHFGEYCDPDGGNLNEVCCAEGCVDTLIDSQNCGGCAIACPEGQACHGGGCS